MVEVYCVQIGPCNCVSTMAELAGVALKTIVAIMKTAQQVHENDSSVKTLVAYVKGIQTPMENIQKSMCAGDDSLVESISEALWDMNVHLQQTDDYCRQVVNMGKIMRVLRSAAISARVKELMASIALAYQTIDLHVNAQLLNGVNESNARARQEQELAERRHQELINRLDQDLTRNRAQVQALLIQMERLGSGKAGLEALAAVGGVMDHVGVGISQLQQELGTAMGQQASTAPEKKVCACHIISWLLYLHFLRFIAPHARHVGS